MAGKKVKGATITFEVSDDGTLKQVGNRAKKTAKDVDKVGKSAGDTRRNMQAMSGRTESASKSFSRMQQGTGGLVQSYAVLASTVFAITAAFQALENAQNIQAQIRGFKELTKVTGTSMLTITNSVRAATGGLLDFQTAAQQTAIAVAAGFSADQIEGLAEGAKNASVALGRDLTDSFNRLIRGVTKAEPELLDELGIILRLDIATRNYAASIGASADKLTIAQRRAAVYNEVNKQLTDNFGAIGEKADELVNPISAFVTKLGDIGIALSEFVLPVFTAFIEFLERNMPILIGLLVIFARKMLRDIVPGAGAIKQKFADWTSDSQKRINALNKRLDQNAKKIKAGAVASGKANKTVSAAFKKSLQKRGVDEKVFFNKSAGNQKRSITAHINGLKKIEKATGRSMARQIAIQRAAYKKIEQAAKMAGNKIGVNINSGIAVAERGLVRMALVGSKALSSLAAKATMLGAVFAGLGTIINYAFAAFMAFMMIQMFVDMIPAVRNAKEAAQELRDVLKESRVETLEFGAAMAAFNTTKLEKVADSIGDADERLTSLANALDHLANAVNNVKLDGIGDSIIDSVEDGLINGGFTTRKWWTLWLGKHTSDSAKSAGEMFGQQVVSGIMGATSLGGEEASKQLLETLLSPKVKEDVRIDGSTGGSFIGTNDMGTTGVHKRIEADFQAPKDERIAAELAAEGVVLESRVLAIQDLIDKFSKETEKGPQEQYLKKITERLADFGVTADRVFKTVTDEDGIERLVYALEEVPIALQNMSTETQVTSDALQSFKNLDEPLKNLAELRNLTQAKPTETQKTASGFRAIGLELDAMEKAGNNGTIAIKVLDKALQEKFKTETENGTLTVDLLEVSIIKLQVQLGLTREQAKVFIENRDTIQSTLDAVAKMAGVSKNITMLNKMELEIAGRLNDRHSKRTVQIMKHEQLNTKILEVAGKIADNSLVLGKQSDLENQAQADKHASLVLQKEELLLQQKILEHNLNYVLQLQDALVETFDQSGGKGLVDMIMGDKSGSEVALEISKSLQQASAGVLSDMIMTPLTGGVKKLFGMEDKIELTPEAKAIQTVHNEHVKALREALQAHSTAIGGTDLNLPGTLDPETGLLKDNTYKDAKDNATSGTDFVDDGLFSGLKEKLSGMFSGLMGSIGGFFSNMFGGFGGLFGGGGNIVGLASGGIMGYDKGGVAKEPTYLVGEGKQNEAVVPLPDNRSIPVNLKGSGGVNNTTISVNIDQSGTNSDITSDEGGALGAMLDAAVQSTLERELRPGGILGG